MTAFLSSLPNRPRLVNMPNEVPSDRVRILGVATVALPAVALAALVALGSVASAQSDKIYPLGQDKPVPGNTVIVDEPLTEVVVQVGGAKTKFPRADGVRVQYGLDEGPFAKAMVAMSGGDYQGALAILEPLKPGREIFVPRRLYLIAKCLEGLGKGADAEKQYSELVTKYENNYWAGQGIRSLVEIQIMNKNYAGAVASADRGVAIAQKLKAEGVAFAFRIYKAAAYDAQDDLKKAETEYRDVVSAAGSSKEGALAAKLANVGLARLAARQGDVPKAKTLVEPILKDTDPVVLAPAYAALGEALLTQGITEKNPDRIREAAIDGFLRVIVQCPPSPSESQEPLEWAIYGYIRAAKRIIELEKKKEEQDFWNQEGLKYCREFRNRFPSSRLMSKVTELQKEFKEK
jgi:tetratricopeptide (TPR) repeat protein